MGLVANMPIFLNRKKSTRLPKGKRRSAPVRPSRRVALELRKAIVDSMAGLVSDINGLIPWIEGTATPAQAARVLKELRDRWRSIYGAQAQRMAQALVEKVSAASKEQLEKNIARSLGIDMTHIFDDQTVREAAEIMSIEAQSLIVTIPERYLSDVRTAVMAHYQQLPLPDGVTLTQRIMDIGGVSDRQANLIARDQTSKINIAIQQARQQSIGIEEYIWSTAKDRRVVGNPGGAYPEGNKVHGDHYSREGKTFRWDKPPYDGHPGYAINCRCVALPIIEVNKLRNAA